MGLDDCGVIYILLYCYKALYLTGILYAIFFALCIAGYRAWLKTFRSEPRQLEAMQ